MKVGVVGANRAKDGAAMVTASSSEAAAVKDGIGSEYGRRAMATLSSIGAGECRTGRDARHDELLRLQRARRPSRGSRRRQRTLHRFREELACGRAEEMSLPATLQRSDGEIDGRPCPRKVTARALPSPHSRDEAPPSPPGQRYSDVFAAEQEQVLRQHQP